MKNFDLTSMGVQEMDLREMQETDGGIIVALLIVAAAGLLLSSCGNNIGVNVNIGTGNTIKSTQSVDTSFNGISVDSTLNGMELTPIQK
jgi:hypothetical protein